MKNETKLKIYHLSHSHLVDEIKHYHEEGMFNELSLEFPTDFKESNVVIWDGFISGKLEHYRNMIHEELEKGKILVHINTTSNDLTEYRSSHVATLEMKDNCISKEEFAVVLNQCFQKLHNV